MRSTTYAKPQAQTSTSYAEIKPFLVFLNAIDYKGEYCRVCGHPWNPAGELHYYHCKYYSPRRIHKK